MSYSDFSISSPRKGKGNPNDKSITNDDDFEKFLNDTSDSEFSSNKFKSKLKTEKPWWMEDDDRNPKNRNETFKGTKSFIKQPKPAITTAKKMAKDEENNQSIKQTEKRIKFKEEQDNSNRYSEDFEQIPALSLDNNSTLSTSREFKRKSLEDYDYDDFKRGEKFDERDEELEQHTEEKEEDESSELSSSPRKSPQIDAFKRTISNETTKKFDTNEGNMTNLLSKVMLDSLESGGMGGMGGTGIIDLNTLEKQLQQTNNTQKLNTQTRKDLEDLEAVYNRNMALTSTGTGLNSDEAQRGTDETQELGQNQDEEQRYSTNSSFNLLNSHVFNSYGLNTIKAITSELENRTLQRILGDINTPVNRVSANKKLKEKQRVETDGNTDNWPPKKFANVRSSGYGTSWSPKSVRRTPPPSQTIGKTQIIPDRLSNLRRSNGNMVNRSSRSKTKNDLLNESNNTSTLQSTGRNDELIANLQDQLVKLIIKQEGKASEMKSDYEKRLDDLRSKLVSLTTELNEKNEELNKKAELLLGDKHLNGEKDEEKKKLKEKCQLLEQNLNEQEKLLKGYQMENERLYSKLKNQRAIVVNENNNDKSGKTNEEIIKLQLENLVKESLNHKSAEHVTAISSEPNVNISQISKPSQTDTKLFADLIKRVEYYEKNQHQIELDCKVIEAKNAEIKKLNEKLKQLEMGKQAPECLREIKRLKQQLKEMDLLVKRMRQSGRTSSMNIDRARSKENVDTRSTVTLSLEYYEKRIEQLEHSLKEKTLDFDRMNRMWQQKCHLYQDIYKEQLSEINIEQRLDEIERKYEEKINESENSNKHLRKMLEEFETRLKEKDQELSKLIKSPSHSDVNMNQQFKEKQSVANAAKNYEPAEFKDNETTRADQSTFFNLNNAESLHNLQNECETLKLALVKSENRLKLAEKDFELRLEQMKHQNEKRFAEVIQKRNAEIECVLRSYTGMNLSLRDLDDPIRMRFLVQTKHNELNQVIQKQKEIIHQLHERLNETSIYQDKCEKLNAQNKQLKEEIERMEEELLRAKKNFTPQMRDFEILNEKLQQFEKLNQKRERDLGELLNGTLNSTSTYLHSITPTNQADHVSNEQLDQIVKHYELQLKNKNQEIKRFRSELDNMLNVLHTLKRVS